MLALPITSGIVAWIQDSSVDVGLDMRRPLPHLPVISWKSKQGSGRIKMERVPDQFGMLKPVAATDRPTSQPVHMPRYHALVPRSALGQLRIEPLDPKIPIYRLFVGTLYPTIYYTGKVTPKYNWGKKITDWHPAIHKNSLLLPSLSPIEQGARRTWAAVATGVTALLFLLLLSAIIIFRILLSINARPAPNRELKPFNPLVFAGFFLPCLLLWGLYLGCVYPAAMTSDSTDQWHQGQTMRFNDVHPAFHSLTLRILSFGTNNPALPAFAQIIFLSLCVAYACTLLLRAGAPRWLAGVAFVILWLSPRNGAMVINIWKDTLFGIAIFAFTLVLAHVYLDYRVWARWRNWLAAGVLAGVIPLFRHNGLAITAAFILMAPVWFPGPARKRALVAAGIAICVLFGVRNVLYPLLKVQTSFREQFVLSMAGKLAAVVDQDAPLSTKEYKFLNRMRPLQDRWAYTPLSNVSILWPKQYKFDLSYAIGHYEDYRKLLLTLHLRYPMIFLRHDKNFAPFIFNPFPSPRIGTISGYTFALKDNKDGIVQRPLWPGLREPLMRIFRFTEKRALMWFFWRSAMAFYLSILAAVVLVWRTKEWSWLVLFMPVWANTVSILIAAPEQSPRYQFPITLVWSFLLALALTLRKENSTLPYSPTPSA